MLEKFTSWIKLKIRKRIARLSKYELNQIKKGIAITILDQKINLPKEVRD